MTWNDSFVHENDDDFLYIKPRPITASPGWSSSAILGTQNLAYGAEYVFSGMADDTDYVVFHRATGFPASTDTVVGELPYPVAKMLEPISEKIDEVLAALEPIAENVTEVLEELGKVQRSATAVAAGATVQVQRVKISASRTQLTETQRIV
jgi:hypothetical protein